MSSETKDRQPKPLIPFRYALNPTQKLDRGDIIIIDSQPMEVRTIDKVSFEPRGYVLIYGKGRDL